MKKFRKKYRIVYDTYCGYECQVWRWWFPFWCEMGISNTHTDIESAKEYIKKSNQKVVWQS